MSQHVTIDLGEVTLSAPRHLVAKAVIGLATGQAPANDPGPALEWSPTLCDGKSVTHAEAEKAAAALGEGWRLPTRWELESILDITRHDPAVDTTRFPDTKSTYYWTSAPCAWNASAVWVVAFNHGSASGLHRNSLACVRAVRSSPAGQ